MAPVVTRPRRRTRLPGYALCDGEDQGELFVYAHRSAFAAVRREDPTLEGSAVTAMSLVTESALGDDRVIWTMAGIVCYAHRRVGGIDRTGIGALLSRADGTVRQAFESMLDDEDPDLVFERGFAKSPPVPGGYSCTTRNARTRRALTW